MLSGPTPGDDLLIAIRQSRLDGVVRALESGADPNLPDSHGWTPLIYAVRQGEFDIVTSLLKAGADPSTEDEAGWTAYAHAVESPDDAVRRLLIDHRNRRAA